MQTIIIPKPREIQRIEREIPEPGPGEVLIQVMASGICGTDIHIFNGEYLGAYPVIPGHEFSGVVVFTGAMITRFKVGDRVAVEPNIACDNCIHCLNNRQNFCLNWQAIGVTLPGGMAQYVTAPEKAVLSIGDLPFEQGAFMEPRACCTASSAPGSGLGIKSPFLALVLSAICSSRCPACKVLPRSPSWKTTPGAPSSPAKWEPI
jgi:D-arabinitol dehydrogenase (NADP+)